MSGARAPEALPVPTRVVRRLAAVILLCGLAFPAGCSGGADPRFASPSATFRTYRNALARADVEASWACLSRGYRQLEFDDDPAHWRAALAGEDGRRRVREVTRLEISQEREINDHLGFLQFDVSTVAEGRSPFFYFLREPAGWMITSHLDSLFRVELEEAIDRGEYRLPR